MFEILRQSLKTGVVTTSYPQAPPEVSSRARGKPEIAWTNWKDARPAAAVCPTGAISCQDASGQRVVRFDLAKCIFCGLCADADPAIRMTNVCECATRHRDDLVTSAPYTLKTDGTHDRLVSPPPVTKPRAGELSPSQRESLEGVGRQIQERSERLVGLNSPIYDIERFGIQFVASPRHADMLLVTGPVTRNMELALGKTYDAMPAPRLVVAVGACGCSGGIFGQNYASLGGVDRVIPVDVYIPGCPPNPHALLHGILLATGRLTERQSDSGKKRQP